jgi:peptide-methionine (S)-S-oxide reductase
MTQSYPAAQGALRRSRPALLVMLAGSLLAAGAGMVMLGASAQEGRPIPAPAVEAQATEAKTEVAILAGGCFWGVQGVFQHVNGVSNAVSGYAGGEEKTATYRAVTSGTTGHAESVRVTFDPRQISYGRILQIYFSVAHDPTELDRQGPDVGTQYRSAVFPTSPEQARIAKAYIAQLNQARAFNAAIVTKIETDRPFYPAEDYHQDYMTLNPGNPYIFINDLPKVENFKRLFPDRYRAKPVLVSDARASN